MSTPLPVALPEEIGLSRSGLARLGQVLQSEIERGRLPGAVAIVLRRGKLGYFEAFGARDPAATNAPMRRDSIFRIYSMTKPIVSVAAMMLWEEGRFRLNDPVARYLPEFADGKVAVAGDGGVTLVPAEREMTVQDLLRHTSGLTYEFLGNSPAQRAYMDAKVFRRNQTNAEQAATLAKLPLGHHPGTRWEYSRATDVLGRLVEVLSDMTLGEFLARKILTPLGMVDTGFFVPEGGKGRLAEAFAKDPDTGGAVQLLEVREKPLFESGGGGLVSTAMDYARFLQMLLNGGILDDARLLGRKTIEYMTADHLGAITPTTDLLIPGYGFGLGFAVRRQTGIAQIPGSTGDFFWGGAAGTTFWVDPAEGLAAVMLIQAPGQRELYRSLFRTLVYAALD
jgi:CubicO group peptidase (beta-lactamase class C family)